MRVAIAIEEGRVSLGVSLRGFKKAAPGGWGVGVVGGPHPCANGMIG